MASENEIKLIPKRNIQVKLLDSLQRDSMADVVKTIGSALGLSETYELTPRDTETIQDVYYDTGNSDLFREQSSLRVRFRGDEITVTVKRNRSRSEGTFSRDEDDVKCDQTTLQRLINEDFVEVRRGRLDHLSGKRLVKMLTVKNSRRIFLMQPRQQAALAAGFRAELSFDMFTFLNARGRSSNEMYELEIEAIGSESVPELERVAANMRTLAPNFLPSVESKYERGVRYFGLASSRPMQLLDTWAESPAFKWSGWIIGLAALILGAIAIY